MNNIELRCIVLALTLIVFQPAIADELQNDNQTFIFEPELFAQKSNMQNNVKSDDFIAHVAGFDIIKKSSPIFTTSNTTFPVVRNKRFNNYGVVSQSIYVQLLPVSEAAFEYIYQKYINDLSFMSYQKSTRLIHFLVKDTTFQNIKRLKNAIEKEYGVKWVVLEIFEHSMAN